MSDASFWIKETVFFCLVQIIFYTFINITKTISKTILIFSLLIFINSEILIIIRKFFVISKQMVFIVKNRDFASCKKIFI